jgi:hypothetical protein
MLLAATCTGNWSVVLPMLAVLVTFPLILVALALLVLVIRAKPDDLPEVAKHLSRCFRRR